MADHGNVCSSGMGLPASGTPRQSHPGAPFRESAENTDTTTSEGSSRRREVICLKMLFRRFLLNKLEHRKGAIKVKNRERSVSGRAIAASLQVCFTTLTTLYFLTGNINHHTVLFRASVQ